MKARLTRYLVDERGAGVAEFVLILPVLFGFLFGFMHMCMMLHTATQLHSAAESAARCASVRADCQTNGAADAEKIATWVENSYRGLAALEEPEYLTEACGNRVTLSAPYVLNTPLFSQTFALSSTACFPA